MKEKLARIMTGYEHLEKEIESRLNSLKNTTDTTVG